MISLETKTDATPSSPLSLSTPEEEPKLSFSELLKGVNKKDSKVVQNGTLVLAFESDMQDVKNIQIPTKATSKNDTFASLLKNEETPKDAQKETLELNPKLTQNLTPKELKVLVSDAKEYLKSKILNSDGFKQSQIKELPKTLKGLASLAKTFSIDISKISIEDVQVHKEQNLKSIDTKVKCLHNQEADIKPLAKDKADEIKITSSLDKKETKVAQPIVENRDKNIKEPVTLKVVQVNKIESIAKVETIKQAEPTSKVEIIKQTVVTETKAQEIPIVEDKKVQALKQTESIKPTLLFKAQSSPEHTTEQIVVAKQFKAEVKTPKEKADDTLKLLLRTDKPALTVSGLTSDFSVATAKVIAPSAMPKALESLEKLLHGESSSEQPANSSNTKTESVTIHKVDSFEVKLNEAKQMIKYISQDIKTAIQDYKSPFTRVKVQLNPQKLGEVDLTIVQRGKNLHVNISSNNTAINTLSMNSNELRAQLNNSGINNATLNFNNSSQGEDSNPSQQQQNRQNEREAEEEYNYFENEETNEEILSSLEIVVPNYA